MKLLATVNEKAQENLCNYLYIHISMQLILSCLVYKIQRTEEEIIRWQRRYAMRSKMHLSRC